MSSKPARNHVASPWSRESEVRTFMRLVALPLTDADDDHAKRAVALFRRGARAGDDSAQLMLGYCFDVGRGVRASKSRALFWYGKSARAGNAAAASNIGTVFRDRGDRGQALRWFRRAVALGEADALFEISKLQSGATAIATLRRLLRARILAPVVREEAQLLLSAYRGRARRSSRRATNR